MLGSLSSMRPRQLAAQVLNFALVLSTAFMLWKVRPPISPQSLPYHSFLLTCGIAGPLRLHQLLLPHRRRPLRQHGTRLPTRRPPLPMEQRHGNASRRSGGIQRTRERHSDRASGDSEVWRRVRTQSSTAKALDHADKGHTTGTTRSACSRRGTTMPPTTRSCMRGDRISWTGRKMWWGV